METRLREDFDRAGKRLDMGKSCVRLHKLEDISLDAITHAVASTPPDAFVDAHERTRAKR